LRARYYAIPSLSSSQTHTFQCLLLVKTSDVFLLFLLLLTDCSRAELIVKYMSRHKISVLTFEYLK
jgi:hypothetical protein